MAATTKTFVDDLPGDPNNSVEAADVNGFKNENTVLITTSGQTPAAGNNNQTSIATSIYSAGAAFYTDSGAADAYVLSPVGGKLAPDAYFNGMRIRFIPAFDNTGASTVNVDSLGVKDIKLSDGVTNPAAGDIMTGIQIVMFFDGTVFRITNFNLASKADMEAATNNERIVTPLRVNDHPAVAKFWIHMDGTGTIAILNSHNVASIVDSASGTYIVNFTTAFSSADYAVLITGGDINGQSFNDNFWSYNQLTTTSVVIRSVDDQGGGGSSPEDVDRLSAVGFGDQ